MTDNARIVREALESARPLLEHGFQEIHADIYSPALQQLYDSFAALTALETELATAKADLEKREWGLQWVLNNLHGIEHEWAKEACSIAREAINGGRT